MNDETVALSITEFEGIKANIIVLEAELERLLAPPPVFATVLKVVQNPSDKNGVQKVLIVYDGKLFEVEASPGMNLKASDNVIVDLVKKRVCRNAISSSPGT